MWSYSCAESAANSWLRCGEWVEGTMAQSLRGPLWPCLCEEIRLFKSCHSQPETRSREAILRVEISRAVSTACLGGDCLPGAARAIPPPPDTGGGEGIGFRHGKPSGQASRDCATGLHCTGAGQTAGVGLVSASATRNRSPSGSRDTLACTKRR